jgi:hypothetical protein
MKKQRRLAEVCGYFPCPLTKESNLSNLSLRLTRRGKQVRAVTLACLFLGMYTGYIKDAEASQAVTEIQTATQASIYSQAIVESKSRTFEPLTVEPVESVKPTKTIKNKAVLSDDELLSVLRSAGFEGDSLRIAWAIVMRESTGNANALNDNPKTKDLSYGLFQINMIGKLGPDRLQRYGLSSYEDLHNPLTNARVAYAMSKSGTDWGPWNIGPNAYDRHGQSAARNSVRKWLDQFPG